MPTDNEFPLVLNKAFVRYCRQLNREHRSDVRIGIDSNGLPQMLIGTNHDPDADLLLEVGGSRFL